MTALDYADGAEIAAHVAFQKAQAHYARLLAKSWGFRAGTVVDRGVYGMEITAFLHVDRENDWVYCECAPLGKTGKKGKRRVKRCAWKGMAVMHHTTPPD